MSRRTTSSLIIEVEEEGEVYSVGELKEQFYRSVTLLKKELWKKYRKKPMRFRIQHPQALILNPPGYGDINSAVHQDVYVAIYYRRFYVRVEQGKSIFGPHKFELFIQVRRGLRVWLGTTIKKFNFYSDKDLRAILKEHIIEEAYYCSPSSAEEIVEFPIQQAAIIDTRHGQSHNTEQKVHSTYNKYTSFPFRSR